MARLAGLRSIVALRRGQTSYFAGLAAAQGDAAFARIGTEDVHLFAHPDQVREVLVTEARHFAKGRGLERTKWLLGNGLLTSEREFHLRQRRLVQPAFHRARVSAYADQMVACTDAHSATWRDGAVVSMAAEMQALTLAVVGRTLFSASVERDAAGVSESLATIFSMFNRMLLPGGELLTRLPLRSSRKLKAARARLDETVYRIIAAHRAAPGTAAGGVWGPRPAEEDGVGAPSGQESTDAVPRRPRDDRERTHLGLVAALAASRAGREAARLAGRGAWRPAAVVRRPAPARRGRAGLRGDDAALSAGLDPGAPRALRRTDRRDAGARGIAGAG